MLIDVLLVCEQSPDPIWLPSSSTSRRRESHGTAPVRFAGLGVSALGLGLGLGLGLQAPNTNTKPAHRWNRCVTGH